MPLSTCAGSPSGSARKTWCSSSALGSITRACATRYFSAPPTMSAAGGTTKRPTATAIARPAAPKISSPRHWPSKRRLRPIRSATGTRAARFAATNTTAVLIPPRAELSPHLENELAPEMPRLAQAVRVGGLRELIELDLGRLDGAGDIQFGNALHRLARARHRRPQ